MNHRVLVQSLDILNYIAAQGRPVSFKEISDYSGLAKSTTHNLIQTMVSMNYLNRYDDTNRYSIGLKCFETGNAYLFTSPFYSMAVSILSNLAMRCNMTTHLGALSGTDVVYLYKIESSLPVRTFSFIGKHAPAHSTALGKALLASLDDGTLDNLYADRKLQVMTPNTISDFDQLMEEIRQIRLTGVAREFEESNLLIKCIGTSVISKTSQTRIGISMAMPTSTPDNEIIEAIQYMLDAKGKIESLAATYEW